MTPAGGEPLAIALIAVTDQLTAQFPSVGADTVRTLVDESAGRFTDATVTDFVPLLVERDTKARLQVLSERLPARSI